MVDTSGSMRGQAIEQTKAAAVDFVNQMPSNVRIGLVSFGETVSVPTVPTTDRALLGQEISALVADSHHTLLYDGVITAVTAYTPAATNKALVVLSDGKDSGSANSLQAAVAAVQGDHSRPSVSPPPRPTSPLFALPAPVHCSAEDPGALSAAFARVADLLTKVVATTPPPTMPAPATTMAPATVPVTTVAPATSLYTRPAPSAEALEPSGPSFPWVPAVAVFGSLVALVLLVWPRQRVLRVRLGIQQPKRMSEMGYRTVSMFEEMVRKGDLANNLSVAKIGIKPGEFVVWG